jgi:hypothetical protein
MAINAFSAQRGTMRRWAFALPLVLVWFCLIARVSWGESIAIHIDQDAAPRVEFGASRLVDAIDAIGFQGLVVRDGDPGLPKIIVGTLRSPAIESLVFSKSLSVDSAALKSEGFLLATTGGNQIAVVGADDSGTLYGCLELADRVENARRLPDRLYFIDAPAFKLRGACIGMQKTYILPGRHAYEYPYTPTLFPFFYDKQFWQQYLDFMVKNRMNTLYLWSGHPFASLVKLKDYPYALEVPEETFQRNVEMFRFIVKEADRRGIWVIQCFYNILVSKPFAEHNGMDTQLSTPTPLVADYTRKSIAEFVRQYPDVGLMFCLGEALQGIDNQVQWCTQVILPGVKDGMAQAHLTSEPPVIIRTHATDARIVVPAALKVYHNIYTEEKYNGESLTTSEPRGVRQALHLAMSKLVSVHMVNVHILANLEPFRYGDQRFIKQCVIAARDRLGARGVHLYPLSYWNWPDSPDIADPPLRQWDRDWIWFESWARYSWNPDIDEATDHAYWVSRLASMYGPGAAESILAAYNDSGECAPRLIRRFGITEGNRQTLSLGMTLDELVNPGSYHPFDELWLSQSPPGERLDEYAEREWKHQPHVGETPPQIISEVLDFSQKAVNEIDAAAPSVTNNKPEFDRLRNDIYCIRAMSQSYCAKANAALLVLRYQYNNDPDDMVKASEFLAQSLEYYRTLARLADAHYQFANAMQTSQRQIPVRGAIFGKPENYLWSQLLPIYENELIEFRRRVDEIQHGTSQTVDEATIKPLPPAAFELTGASEETYTVRVGAAVFSDKTAFIMSVAPELRGLVGIRISEKETRSGNYQPIEFSTSQPVQVLIGYFNSADTKWLQPPQLETDALAAERGSTAPLIRNAVAIPGLPPVDVYTQYYGAGQHKLEMHGSGSFIVLGVIPRSVEITPRDAHLAMEK